MDVEATPLSLADDAVNSSSSSSSGDDEPIVLEDTPEEAEFKMNKLLEKSSDACDPVFGPRTENEKVPTSVSLDPLPNDVQATDEVEIFGTVMSLNANRKSVVVQSSGSAEINAVDIDSVICTSDRQLVGRIEEVFGPVIRPFYLVRLMGLYDPDFTKVVDASLELRPIQVSNEVTAEDGTDNVNSESKSELVKMKPIQISNELATDDKTDIANNESTPPKVEMKPIQVSNELATEDKTDIVNNESNSESKAPTVEFAKLSLVEGEQLYCVTRHMSHIDISVLNKIGSDASNLHDEEADELDFSDDEEEAAAKQRFKALKQASRNGPLTRPKARPRQMNSQNSYPRQMNPQNTHPRRMSSQNNYPRQMNPQNTYPRQMNPQNTFQMNPPQNQPRGFLPMPSMVPTPNSAYQNQYQQYWQNIQQSFPASDANQQYFQYMQQMQNYQMAYQQFQQSQNSNK